MKLKYLLSGVAAAALVSLPIAQPGVVPFGVTAVQAREANVSINVFFDALAGQGDWVRFQDYGYVWVPDNVSSDWAPYTHGHWANTERYGWTFVSDEPFAWAVYHYGRWGYDPDIGWFWVPGTVWAPAWVSWRRSNEVVGWAPLPPEGGGYAVSIEVSSAEPPRGYWHFVPAREFLAPDLAAVIVHDESPYEQTEFVGPVIVQNNVVVNNVIDVDFIQQASGQQVTTTEVQVVKDPTEARRAAQQQGAVVAVEGQLAEPAQDAAPRKVVEATKVKAPTAGQDVETTTGSVKPNDQAQPNQVKPGAAGQATGGERAGGADTGGAAQPSPAAPGAKPKIEGQDKAAKNTTGEESGGSAGAKPKIEGQDKAAKGTTTGESGRAAAGKAETQQPGATASGDNTKAQPSKKPKVEQDTTQGEAATQPDQGKQAQGAGDENGTRKSAQKKLKNEPGTSQPGEATQSQDNTGQASQGAAATKRQAAEKPAQEPKPAKEAQGAEGKGPRKLKPADQEQPSQEKTGAIPGAKAKGAQGGGEQAPANNPEAAAPKAQGKAKGCSAEEQAAGSC